MRALCLVLVAALALGGVGCETLERINAKIPDGEFCVIVRGKKVCAVKRDGKWTYSVDLGPEERLEVEALIAEGP